MMKWYIVQSYSGFEKKVSEQIQEELEKANLSDHFDQVLVPTQDVTEIKKGNRMAVLSEIALRAWFGRMAFNTT